MQNWFPQIPAWMRKQQAPRTPFMDVAQGTNRNAFNPGGAFGTGSQNQIPSAQRWNRLAPSEQQGMQGYWQDELGVYADDVMDTMNKLRPRGAINSAPRWTM